MFSLIRPHHGPFTGFERFFDDSFNARVWVSPFSAEEHLSPNCARRFDGFRPRMDLEESKDLNVVTATFEFPGLRPEDIVIELQQDRLTVTGVSSAADSHEGSGHAVRERRRGKFTRVLVLPSGTKPEDVKARMENGLLTITFPKTNPEQQPHRITIQ